MPSEVRAGQIQSLTLYNKITKSNKLESRLIPITSYLFVKVLTQDPSGDGSFFIYEKVQFPKKSSSLLFSVAHQNPYEQAFNITMP